MVVDIEPMIATKEAARATVMMLLQQNQDLQDKLDQANTRIAYLEAYGHLPSYPTITSPQYPIEFSL